MKKVKIMLTAIAVLAVVGGALAFKANRQVKIFCSDHPTLKAFCVELTPSTFTQDDSGPSYCTTVGGTTCNIRAITDVD